MSDAETRNVLSPLKEEGLRGDGKARWYVVHTYSGHEKKVKMNIEKMVETRNMQDLILEVVVPTEDRIVMRADGKKDITRELRWNTSQSTITYRADKKAKNGKAPVETFGAGLLCLWAKETDKNAGDLFTRFDTENSTYAANQVGTTNAKNQKNNMAYNVYLLPVAVYAVTGVA